jgi:RND family efflux transporter MFP subunit
MSKIIRRMAGWFQLLFVVAVVGAAILVSVSLQPESSNRVARSASDAVPVSVVLPEPVEFEPSVNLNGVVATRTRTNVVPQVGGRVVEVSPSFRPGASFAEGDVLFRIDPADYELAVERTLAEIEAARSELALLEAQAEAEQKVWDQQFSDRKIPDLVARVPQIAAAEARIKSGQAARSAAQLSLARTVVRAPFDGRVLDTSLDIGQVVGAGVAVGSIFSDDSLEISVPVSSEELALLGDAVGRRASILREGEATPGLELEVVRQSASLDERTRLRTLYLAADKATDLTLGEFVGVEIRGDAAPEMVEVPAASLTSRNQVWVVQAGTLQPREVQVISTDDSVAVVREFDAAEGIVTVPPANSRNGLPVVIQAGQSASGGASNPVAAR